MANGYTPGDKPKMGNPVDLGLNDQSKVDGGTRMKLRDETDLETQRPKARNKKVSSDRGTFTDKC